MWQTRKTIRIDPSFDDFMYIETADRSHNRPAVFSTQNKMKMCADIAHRNEDFVSIEITPIDLHTHSTKSDGTCTPSELVEIAVQKGLSAFALTDHDTTDGIEEAMTAARGTGIELIPGVELSTQYQDRDIHIVGLYPDYNNSAFKERIKTFADDRDRRNQKICALLTADGYELSCEELMAAFPNTVITRAHFAQLLTEKGITSSINEAFKKFLGDDCKYFVPREKITPAQAVRFLREFHGVSVLAHPLQYHFRDDELTVLIETLCKDGLMGIEAYYNNHTPSDTAKIIRLAQAFDLVISGGSDFHGTRKKDLQMGTGYGRLFVPNTLLGPIKEKSQMLRD